MSERRFSEMDISLTDVIGDIANDKMSINSAANKPRKRRKVYLFVLFAAIGIETGPRRKPYLSALRVKNRPRGNE